jgi:hypothetical protein
MYTWTQISLLNRFSTLFNEDYPINNYLCPWNSRITSEKRAAFCHQVFMHVLTKSYNYTVIFNIIILLFKLKITSYKI